MTPENLKTIVEAIVFAADEPLNARRIAGCIDGVDGNDVRKVLKDLKDEYDAQARGFSLEEIAGGWQLLSRKEYAPYIAKLQRSQSGSKLSQAALETMAIIAYKQPLSRADVEDIRGVQAGPILQALVEKGLIKIVGRADVIGRPFLYGTTKKFLDQFGLKGLGDLPKAEDLTLPPEQS